MLKFGIPNDIIISINQKGEIIMSKEKVCVMCEKEYIPTGRCQKVCTSCRPEWEKKRAHEAHIKRYVRKGYSQKGENNNSYKNGIGFFRRKAIEHYGAKCMRCGSSRNICVHHKDRNRENNDISNLEVVCKSCHQKEHDAAGHLNCREALERNREKIRLFALTRTDLERDEKGRFRKKQL